MAAWVESCWRRIGVSVSWGDSWDELGKEKGEKEGGRWGMVLDGIGDGV